MIPIIKLTTEHMQQEILHALNVRQDEYREALADGLKHAVESFDFEDEVKERAENQLRVMCNDLIRDTVMAVVWDQSFRQQLKERLIKELKKKEES